MPGMYRPSTPRDLCCAAHKNKLILSKLPTTKTLEPRLQPFFSLRTFRFSALAPDVPIESKLNRVDMSSLVDSRECAKATARSVSSFGADLVAVV